MQAFFQNSFSSKCCTPNYNINLDARRARERNRTSTLAPEGKSKPLRKICINNPIDLIVGRRVSYGKEYTRFKLLLGSFGEDEESLERLDQVIELRQLSYAPRTKR